MATKGAIQSLGGVIWVEGILSEQITKRLGDGWTMGELENRLRCMVFPNAGNKEIYTLDGQPLLEIHPPRVNPDTYALEMNYRTFQ